MRAVVVLELAIRELILQHDCQGLNSRTYGKACSNHTSFLNAKQELVQYGTPVMPEIRI